MRAARREDFFVRYAGRGRGFESAWEEGEAVDVEVEFDVDIDLDVERDVDVPRRWPERVVRLHARSIALA